MYVKRIYLENIRCFEEFELEFKAHGESALFAADNGDGKTTLLRSIAIGLCDETSAGALLRDTNGETIRMGKEEGRSNWVRRWRAFFRYELFVFWLTNRVGAV